MATYFSYKVEPLKCAAKNTVIFKHNGTKAYVLNITKTWFTPISWVILNHDIIHHYISKGNSNTTVNERSIANLVGAIPLLCPSMN
jgi:hypothetical protein